MRYYAHNPRIINLTFNSLEIDPGHMASEETQPSHMSLGRTHYDFLFYFFFIIFLLLI